MTKKQKAKKENTLSKPTINLIEYLMDQLQPLLDEHHQKNVSHPGIFEKAMNKIDMLVHQHVQDKIAKEAYKDLLLQHYTFQMPISEPNAYAFFQATLGRFEKRFEQNPEETTAIDLTTLLIIERYFYWVIKENVTQQASADTLKEQLSLVSLNFVLSCFKQYFSEGHRDKKNEYTEEMIHVYISMLISVTFLRNTIDLNLSPDLASKEFFSNWFVYFDAHFIKLLYDCFRDYPEYIKNDERVILLKTFSHSTRPKMDVIVELFKLLKANEYFDIVNHLNTENEQIEIELENIKKSIQESQAQILKIKKLQAGVGSEEKIFHSYSEKITQIEKKISNEMNCYIAHYHFQNDILKKITPQKTFDNERWAQLKQNIEEKISEMHHFLSGSGNEYNENPSLPSEYVMQHFYLLEDLQEKYSSPFKSFFQAILSSSNSEKISNASYIKTDHIPIIFTAIEMSQKGFPDKEVIALILQMIASLQLKHAKESKQMLHIMMKYCSMPIYAHSQCLKLNLPVEQDCFPTHPHPIGYFFLYNKYYKDRKKHHSSYVRYEDFEIPLSVEALDLEIPRSYPDKIRFSNKSAYNNNMKHLSFSYEEALSETREIILKKSKSIRN